MGFQGREQKEFQGLYTTRKGASAPRWSAEDVTNIDFTFRSIRGRAPTVRAIGERIPHAAWAFDSGAAVQSNYANTSLALSGYMIIPSLLTFCVRAYVSGLDLYRLSEYAVGTRWCIVGSTGDSTDFGAGTGQVGGWALFLEHHAQGEFRFTAHYRQVDTATGLVFANGSIVVDDIEAHWDSPDDVFCLEWSWNLGHTEERLEFYMNGSGSASEATTAVISGIKIHPSTGSTHYLNIGVVASSANLASWLYPFIGVIGPVLLIDLVSGNAATSIFRWQMIPAQEASAGTAYDRLALAVQPEGEGWRISPIGTSDFTNAGAGKFFLNPPPAILSGSLVQIHPGAFLECGNLDVRIDHSKVWGVLGGFTVHAPPPGGFSAKAILCASGTAYAPGLDWEIDAVAPAVSGYRLTLFLALRSTGDVLRVATATTADLVFGTAYRFAFFVERNFDFGTDQTTVELWTKAAGTWTSAGTDTDTGRSSGVTALRLNPAPAGAPHGFRFDATDVRIHANLASRPASSAAINAMDVYPPTSQLTWPASVLASFDLAVASTVEAETLADARERLLSVREGKLGVQSLLARGGECPWAAMGFLSGGVKPKVRGIHTGSVLLGRSLSRTIDVLLAGGVWRYDIDKDFGSFLRADLALEGEPDVMRSLEFRDRVVFFGEGATPVKVYPGGIARVGHAEPFYQYAGTGVSSAANGGLAASTGYYYRLSTYNSVTGQESNLGGFPETLGTAHGTTSPGHDTLTMTVSNFHSPSGDDWDTINIYRRAQVTGLWHLEQQVPRPRTPPPVGPDIVFTSSLSETELVLQPQEQIDHHPPEDFVAAGIVGRSLVVGGGGLHPGWAYYSTPNLYESFPPLNVWRLNDDDSDGLVGVFTVLGRMILLKRKSLYTARDDAPDTGEEPMRTRDAKGCVGPAACCMADNQVFFLSPDRCVFVTDGVEVADVSSPTLKQTLEGLTDDQVAGAQMAHDARGNKVWLSIPPLSGVRREVFALDYQIGRWTRYELPHDIIASGAASGALHGDSVLIGGSGWVYRMGFGRKARDSDTSAGSLSFDYAESEFILNGTTCHGFKRAASPQWDADIEGMPVVVIFYTGAAYAGTPPRDHPLWRSTAAVHYSTVQKVGASSPYEFWLANEFAGADAYDRALVLVGTQIRRYLAQWYSPDGEGKPHTFFGYSFVRDPEIDTADDDSVFRAYVDYEGAQIGTYDATQTPTTRLPDHAFLFRRVGRRIQYEILSGSNRDTELEIQTVALRYRVRGSRRPW